MGNKHHHCLNAEIFLEFGGTVGGGEERKNPGY